MREGFPGRIAYLFTGLPAALLLNSLLIRILTPALRGSEAQVSILGGGAALAFIALAATVSLTYARAQRLEWEFAPGWALLACVPILGVGVTLWLASVGDRDDARHDTSAWQLAGQLAAPALAGWLFVALLTTLLNLGLGLLGLEVLGFYLSGSILVLTPLATAFLAGFLAGRARRSAHEAMAVSALALLAIMTALGFAMMEGVVCMAMAAPLVCVLGLPASLLGHWYGRKSPHSSTRVQCAAWLAVAACAVGEATLPTAPLEDTVTTEIIVDAPPAKVWAELKDIRGLAAPTETLFVLGVAHPVETVVEGEGRVGAHRVCRLSTGDMTELISVWKPEQALRFTVLDTPPLMREATFFGRELDAPHLHGTYVGLEGGFRLEALPDGRTRLIGSSRYALNLAPAPYWNLWTREIVSLVHHRVLSHVKAKAEAR